MTLPAEDPAPGGPAAPTAAITLRSSEFRRGREQAWQELELLVDKAERRGLGTLGAEELQRLPLLYRSALSSLSVARAIALDRNLRLYLENLGLRTFLVIYAPRKTILEGCREFLWHWFPARVRASRWHILLSFAAILLGTLAGFLLVAGNPAWFSSLIPGDLGGDRSETTTREELLNDEIFAPWPGFTQSFIVFANFLFRHNTLVGLLTFGFGIAAGVPTLLLLAYQGLVFGAFIALHDDRGLLLDFIGWVSIHGVTEFGAIILCGASGLVIAQNILFPGDQSRLANVAARGQDAAQLVVGAVLMFFIAGLIEGGLRQLVADTGARLAIAGLTALLWLAYFTLAGRRSAP
jgi:uncharacterized membrane protein SpoIIM required for sporulation